MFLNYRIFLEMIIRNNYVLCQSNSEDQVSFQLLTLWTKSTSIVNDVVYNNNNRMTQKVEKKPLNEY